MSTKAIYPGTFDPITLGHMDLIIRASKIFDKLILAISKSTKKNPLFSLSERVKMAQELCKKLPNVTIKQFDGILVDFVRKHRVKVIVRGLRAFSDFEYEFQMALTNRQLANEIETLFLMPTEDYSYITSSMVREIASFGGDTSKFVPPLVQKALFAKFKKQ
jgi:pantetheine-phosphate adenylyltransferase